MSNNFFLLRNRISLRLKSFLFVADHFMLLTPMLVCLKTFVMPKLRDMSKEYKPFQSEILFGFLDITYRHKCRDQCEYKIINR